MKLSPARIIAALRTFAADAPLLPHNGRRFIDPVNERKVFAATGKPNPLMAQADSDGRYDLFTRQGIPVDLNFSNRRELVVTVGSVVLREPVGAFGLRQKAATRALYKRAMIEIENQQAKQHARNPGGLAPASDRAAIINAHAPVRIGVTPPEGLSFIEAALYRTSPLAAEILSHRAKGVPFTHESGLSGDELLEGLQAQMLHDLSRQQ